LEQGTVVEPAEALGIEGASSHRDLEKDVGIGTVGIPVFVVVPVQNGGEIDAEAGAGGGHGVALADRNPIPVVAVAVPGKNPGRVSAGVDDIQLGT
jgi:hypothetical protein